MPALTPEEVSRFHEEGWLGPYPLLEPSEARALEPELARCFSQTRGYFYPKDVREGDRYYEDRAWFQSLHTLSPALAGVGRRPEIVERVAELLGDDLLQWAGIRFEQAPQSRLHWHTDTEYDYWSGVSVWLGIQDVTPQTALKLLPGSDRYPVSPEDLQRNEGVSMESLASDEEVLRVLGRVAPELEPKIVQPPVHDGEFILFKGKLWHGSRNPTDAMRVAMGLRYATPDQHVRIPLTYLPPIIFDPTPAPCLLVRGEDRFGCNRVVPAPE